MSLEYLLLLITFLSCIVSATLVLPLNDKNSLFFSGRFHRCSLLAVIPTVQLSAAILPAQPRQTSESKLAFIFRAPCVRLLGRFQIHFYTDDDL